MVQEAEMTVVGMDNAVVALPEGSAESVSCYYCCLFVVEPPSFSTAVIFSSRATMTSWNSST
jgi:hypothetical protein